MTARPQRPRERPGLPVRAVDARARGGPVSGLRVVRHPEGRLSAVPDHVCRGDRAVSRLRRGHVIPYDDIASPCRRRTCACSSAARWPSPLAVLFFAGAGVDAGVLPARSVDRAPARRRRRRPQDQRIGARAVHGDRAADAARHPARRRQGADRQVQRLSVSGLRPVVPGRTSRSSRSTKRSAPGAVRLVLKDYPAQPRLQPEHASMLHAGRVRRGGGRPAGARAQSRRGDGGVALHAPAG